MSRNERCNRFAHCDLPPKWPSIHVAGLVMASISGVEEDHDCSSCFAGQKLHRAKKTSFCLSLTGQ